MTKFQTLQELRLERQKLYLRKEFLEDEIHEDYLELRESLKPMNIIKGLIMPNRSEHKNGSEISPTTLNIGSTLLDMLVSKVVFKNASFIKKIATSYIIRSAGTAILEKIAPTLLSKIKSIYSKYIDKKEPEPYDY